MAISKTDLKVLSYLRSDARSSISSISAEIDVPVSSVLSRLRMLEDKIIKKYSTLLNYSKIGFVQINLIIMAGARKSDKDALRSFLMEHPNVNSLFQVSDGFDFYLETVFKDIKGFYDFTDSLSSFKIRKIEEHHVIEEIKKEEFLTKDSGAVYIEYPRHMFIF
ncbi:Lrp/AsnC family transcriptional regulator [Candidatus Woesearchaeota archaeon]|nr:Lrp/AsnC family transcriptional regulator [Candidatus Woesearchaeota archaeon]